MSFQYIRVQFVGSVQGWILDDEDDDDVVSFFMVPLLGELKVTERSMCLTSE